MENHRNEVMLLPRFDRSNTLTGNEASTVHQEFATWLVAIAVCCGSLAHAQNYPTKPIRMLTAAPGGSNDLAARLVAQGLGAALGQQVVIENRGGGGIAPDIVSQAPPDGYTLIFYGSALWLLPLFNKSIRYDVERDFATISWVSRQPDILVVHPSLPVHSVTELIDLAKAKPGTLNYSSGSDGSTGHVAAELFRSMAGIEWVRVNYKGSGPATNDLVAGHVQLAFATISSIAPHVKSGRLRALAITSAEPSALFPGLTTVAAAGLPGYESVQMAGVFAPARTPPAIINRLNEEIVRMLNAPEVRERIFQSGSEVIASSPEVFREKIKAEMARVSKLIVDRGMRTGS